MLGGICGSEGVSFISQQPKFGFLPEAERGGTEFSGNADPGAGRTAHKVRAKATFKAKPVS